ncbi:MAG: RNA polymerase subunit sigma-70 [Bradyrhizobium sp.]|uniref:RNA polymerase sigma factor region1.1 domain-containing protein n=1 Tax=Bradyrhizobium sp. TaxID=376 RepID=UPI001C288F8A|nr:RNA polymerase sigma factor region1.1 domain-containing protein [Bradyrhizobium sp.]MBU6462872.1 RNA polymerase subunit sigma-70 [Pseudomonadota bacterium]MDE2066006.1 RNA polymerase subunit sigma-70 [Bradyrhizobium sp.]MDE2471285.1 RNA polymerase subunit sigma-70 [Bradyrhizobium sp.]
MDWSEIMRKVTALAECKGYLTFVELDQVIPPTLQSEDIESLLAALSDAGIRVQEE